MGNRRKVVRKLKRQLRRKNAGKSTPTTEQNRSNAQQTQTDMMMRLAALLGGGRGNVVTTQDPSSFLNSREAAAAWQNELSRKKHEEKAKKRAAEDERTRIKMDEEYEIAKHGARAAEADAKHEARMSDMRMKKTGAQGVIADLQERIRKVNEQIAENEAAGSISSELRKVTELQNTIKKLEDEVGYKIKTNPELMRIYTGMTDKLQAYINKFNEVHQGLIQLGELRETDKVTQDLISAREEVDAEMRDLIRHVHFETKVYKETAAQNEARLNEMTEKKYQLRSMQQELATAKDNYENSKYTYDFDEKGDLRRVYNESDKLPIIRPEDDANVILLKKEIDKLFQHIKQVNPTMSDAQMQNKIKEIARGAALKSFTSMQSQEITTYNKALSSKSRIKSPASKKMLNNEIVSLCVRYMNKTNEYEQEYKAAQQRQNEAIARNKEVEQSWHPAKVEVTDEMIEKINKEHTTVRDAIDELNKQTLQNKEKNKRLKELATETIDLKKQLEKQPDPAERDKLLDDLRQAEDEKKRLERELNTRVIREQEHDKMRHDTERLKVQNELMSKQLDEYNSSIELRSRQEKEAIEARVRAEKQKDLNEAKMQTHKAEQEQRMAEHQLNVQHSDQVKAMDEQIMKEYVKQEEARMQKQQIESMRRAKESFREQQLAAQAMRNVDICTKGVNGFENLTAQLNAVGQKLIDAADDKMRNDEYVRKKADTIVDKLYKDPLLMLEVTRQYEQQGKLMFKSPDDLRARLNTRDKVDQYDHWLHGIKQQQRPQTPPMQPGNMYRFYGPAQESSTREQLFDDDTDEE